MNLLQRLLPVVLCAPLAGHAHAQAPDHAAWTHRATLTIPAAGLYQLDLPADVRNASASLRASPLADLRLVSPDGVETPYGMVPPQLEEATLRTVTDFHPSLAGETTVIRLTLPQGGIHDQLKLQTNAASFIKAATLEGSADGMQWRTLTTGEILCRQDGTERLTLPLPSGDWKQLRVTLDDHRSGPVVFTGANVRLRRPAPPTLPQPATIRERRELKGETRLIVDLGSAHVYLGVLRLETPEPVFRRQASVLAEEVPGTLTTIAAQSLFRLRLDDYGASGLEIPVHRLITTREIEVRLKNDDSPPLQAGGITATRHPFPMMFHAGAAGAWQLYTGNPQSAPPRYDFDPLSSPLRRAAATNVAAEPLTPNPAFRGEAAIPETGDGGAVLDGSAWGWRKPVCFAGTGVVGVELDPTVLSRSPSGWRDLRLLQEGRQLPYLLQFSDGQRSTDTAFTPEPDPKRPGWSRWRITLPAAALPVRELLARSPTTLFERSMELWENTRDPFGTPQRRRLGSALWQQTPAGGSPDLRLALHQRPSGDTLWLETDDGDNAPLQLTSLHASWPLVTLVFKVDTDSPVYLCYGNPKAAPPQYDLRLVQKELTAAARIAATLGPEETLTGAPRPVSPPGTGSPWLWAALAVVVGGLLWAMAKLLPKQPAGTSP